MNNVFATYYLQLFLHSGITPLWFYGGQTLFMLWNAINDPLFGWLSDNYLPVAEGGGRRTTAIKYGGLLWAVAFVLVWFPPTSSALLGLHFVFSLCFYDGMLSYVEVNHNALLAEMTVSEAERAKVVEKSTCGVGSPLLRRLISCVTCHSWLGALPGRTGAERVGFVCRAW